MPTQEERLSTLEQTVPVLKKGIQDLNYNATILLGVISEQGKDIREVKVSLAVLNERLGAFEQNVNNRFEKQEHRFETLEHRFEKQEHRFETLEHRFETLEHRFEMLEQSVNSRFDAQDKKFEAHDKKFEQVLLLLNMIV